MKNLQSSKDSNPVKYGRVWVQFEKDPSALRKMVEEKLSFRQFMMLSSKMGSGVNALSRCLNKPESSSTESLEVIAKALSVPPFVLIRDFNMCIGSTTYGELQKYQKAYQNEIEHRP